MDEQGEQNNQTARGSFKQHLLTQDPRERKPGLLTYEDREYLLGEKELETPSEAQLRQRLRDRVRNGLLDAELLLAGLSEPDTETIFDDMTNPPWVDEPRRTELYHGGVFTLGFLYYGISEHTRMDFEEVLEEAIQRANLHRNVPPAEAEFVGIEASVDIDVSWEVPSVDVEEALDKLRAGDRLGDHEIAALVRSSDLDEDDWDLLRERFAGEE